MCFPQAVVGSVPGRSTRIAGLACAQKKYRRRTESLFGFSSLEESLQLVTGGLNGFDVHPI